MKAPSALSVANVDGTLVTQEKVLTHNARQVVAQLGQTGILFAITSGRPPRGMQNLIKDLNISTVAAALTEECSLLEVGPVLYNTVYGRLSRRRHSCTEGRPWVRNLSGVSQTS